MNKDGYLSEVERRLRKYFSALSEGYKVPAEDRHRLEGFMQGADFLGFATGKEMAELMERAHFAAFGKTIDARRTESVSHWQDSVINYARYDQPAYRRKKS
ncbi:hypothetical protein [Pseudomonas saliphila]|uniref:hypothetical protein n=1 Tax=Pseudomonas saliphila TaxID=2586906 RepID=UPI00123C0900|nr:hypothetical protein [Pseudomonas saliphila]